MRLSRLYVAVLALSSVAAVSASATSVRPYIHPSSNGDACVSSNTSNGCIQASDAGLTVGGSPVTLINFGTRSSSADPFNITNFDVFNVNGINPGIMVTFTFTDAEFNAALNGAFGVIGCGEDQVTQAPGIFNSSNKNLDAACTNLPFDPIAIKTIPPTSFFTETDDPSKDQISLLFNCLANVDPCEFPGSYTGGSSGNTPYDWGFFTTDGAAGLPISVDFGGSGNVPTPEPNTIWMLASGLLGLALLSLRKYFA